MRQFRRFELHRGNKELFWEISRHDKEIITRSGKLKKKPGEKDPHPKREDKKDFRVAQLEYDKLIQRKLKLGYVEVDAPSTPSEDLQMHAVRLVSLDGNHELLLTEAQIQALLSYMIDLEVINKRIDLVDISKWERRVLRRSSHSTLSDLEPLSKEYNAYFDQWRKSSQRDRAVQEADIPSFKYTDRNYWIVTGEECKRIHFALDSKLAKKREKLAADGKPSSSFLLREKWNTFHKQSIAGNGYEVVPADIQLHTIRGGSFFFSDLRQWNDIYQSLLELDVWDDTPPLHKSEEFESLQHFIVKSTLTDMKEEEELEPLDDGTKHDLESQLLKVSELINAQYRTLLKQKDPEKDVDDIELVDYGFKWNITNLKRTISTLKGMEEHCFDEDLLEYYNEQLSALVEDDEEEIEQLDQDTKNVINDIMNDACHLVNHSHQNIHNAVEVLIAVEEDVSTDIFNLSTLPRIIECLEDLYPDIESIEQSEDSKIEDVYTYRPSGLDGELMEDWLHLLPDALDCISLLQSSYVFEQLKMEIKETFPSAKRLLETYLKDEIRFLEFQSALARKRKSVLASSSNKPGKILLFKLNNLSEPWAFSEEESSLLINALEQIDTPASSLIPFLKEAESNGGFNSFTRS